MLVDEDLAIAYSFRPPGFWSSLGLKLRAHVVGSIAISIIAWLVSMPLVAYHFNQINPWAVLTGLLLLPAVVIGLVGGLAKIVLTLLLPGFAHTWAILATGPMIWMQAEVHWLAHLPGANVPMSPPPVWGDYPFLCGSDAAAVALDAAVDQAVDSLRAGGGGFDRDATDADGRLADQLDRW